jgi:biopolymer transport protein ExbD
MARRNRHGWREESGVDLSPLIDCVFLLLIFFLVTTMIKRKEKLIPVRLPDMTSQISGQVRDDTIVIGVDRNGGVFRAVEGRRDADGELFYEPVESLSVHLKSLVDAGGTEVRKRPLRLDADRDLEFQKAIDLVDVCRIQGFENVGVRTRQRAL